MHDSSVAQHDLRCHVQARCTKVESTLAESRTTWTRALESCRTVAREHQAALQHASDRIDRLQEQSTDSQAGIEACEQRISALKDFVPQVHTHFAPLLPL